MRVGGDGWVRARVGGGGRGLVRVFRVGEGW